MNITANETTRKRFSIFAILLIALSTIFQPLVNVAFAADSSTGGNKESCDCIHMEKDVEGGTTYEVDREKKFDFNLKLLIPKETADQSNKVIVSDVVDNRLTVHGASVVTKDGETVQGLNVVVDGQEVSLTLTNETKDKWNDKELHVKIVASINEDVESKDVIPNTFTIDLDGKKYTSNEVTVKTKNVPLTPIKPVETEMPKIKKDVEGKTSHGAWKNEKFTFNIKTTVPNNLSSYEGLMIVDVLDEKFKIDSTKVLVNGKESKYQSIVRGQEVSLEISKEELKKLKGAEVTIQIQVIQQMVYSDKDRTNKATVIVKTKNGNIEENKEVKSNEVRIEVPRVKSVKTVEGNIEIVNEWSQEYKASSSADEYTFVIKTQLPKLEQLGEGLTYFKFDDRIDQNLEVISADVFLDDVPYTNLASNFVDSIGVGQSFNLEDYKGMQGKEMTVKITVKAKDGKYPKEVANQANITFNFEGTEFTGVGNSSNNVTVKYPDVQPKINKRVNGKTSHVLSKEDEEFYFEIAGFVSEKYSVFNRGAADTILVVDELDERFEVISTELKVENNVVENTEKYITLKNNNLEFKVGSEDVQKFFDKEFVIKINAKLKEGITDKSVSNNARLGVYKDGNSSNFMSDFVYVYLPVKPEPVPNVSVEVQKVWKGKKQNNVTVELFADGKKVNQVALSDSNNWKHKFTNLDGSKTYTVKEVKVEGYETKITGNQKNGFVITNTEIVEPTPEQPKTDLPLVCECEEPTPTPEPTPEVCTDFTLTVKGKDVSEVDVVIQDKEGNVFAEGKTDKIGKFTTDKPLVVDEEYIITVTKEGYEKATKTVTGQEDNCFTEIEMQKVKPVDPKPEEPKVCTDFTVTVKGNNVENVKIEIKDKDGNVFAEGKTNKNGKFVTDNPLNVDEEYTVIASKSGYKTVSKAVKGQTEDCFTEIEMKKRPSGGGGSTPPKVCDDFTVKTESNAKVVIKDEEGKVFAEGETDKEGKFVSRKPLEKDEKYTVEVTKEGYKSVEKVVIGETEDCFTKVPMEKEEETKPTPEPEEEPTPEPKPEEEPKVCDDFTVNTVPGAKVTVVDEHEKVFAEGAADKQGKFVIEKTLGEGKYQVIIEAKGYETETFIVESNEECQIELPLKEKPQEDEEVAVPVDEEEEEKGEKLPQMNQGTNVFVMIIGLLLMAVSAFSIRKVRMNE